MKQQAAVNVFASAGTVVDNALTTHVGRRDPCGELPLPSSLARAANRYRTKNRPRHPDTLDFEVDSHHIPDGFLRIDISSAHARHLLLASDAQLYLLSKAKTWYACTVILVYLQLFNIN